MKEFIYKHRVRYADTDKMGVVYHGRYFEWFEAARTEMLRNAGMSYDQIEKTGVLLPVIEANCKYFVPVVYDEIVDVKTTLKSFSRAKIWLAYEVFVMKEEIPRAEGYTVHCFINKEGRPVRATPEMVKFFKTLY